MPRPIKVPLKKARRTPAARARYNFSMSAEIIEPFRKLCVESGISLSRIFEEFADVFLHSMKPGDDLRSEYRHMLSLYYRDRRDNRALPLGMDPSESED